MQSMSEEKMLKSLPPMPSVTRSVSSDSASSCGAASLPSKSRWLAVRSAVSAAEQVTSV